MRYRHRHSQGHAASFVTSTSIDGVTSRRDIVVGDAESASTYDEVVPNFKKRSAAGEIFNNEFTSLKTRYLVSGDRDETFQNITDPTVSSAARWSNGYALDELFQSGQLPFPAVGLDTETAERKAQIQVTGSINKTAFDLGTFVGEWEKSRQLHRDLGSALVRLATEYNKEPYKTSAVKRINLYDHNGDPILTRKGKPAFRNYHDLKVRKGGKLTFTRNAANLFLLGRFGISPLLHDLDNALKLLLKTNHFRETSRGFGDVEAKETAVKLVSAFNGLNYTLNLTVSRAVNYRYGILYETDAASRLAGNLGITRPLSTLWELAPYSFVVDRFIQIGQWLDAMQPSGSVRTLAAWASTTETVVKTVTVNDSLMGVGYGGRWAGNWSGALVHTTVSKRRVPWTITVPKRPVVSTEYSNLHALDYVALVLQKLSGKT